MEFKNIILEKKAHIATIILNRPKVLNAMNGEMLKELGLAIQDLGRDKNTKVVIITGAGRAFCSGGDVSSFPPGKTIFDNRDYLKNIHKWFIDLVNLEKPVIAAVNGIAVGGGFNLALAADIIIASEEAKFSQIFVKVGLIPDLGGLYFLPRLVGLPKAKELIFTGDMIDAKEAEEIGIVNRVVPAAKLNDTVNELAEKLTKCPSMALAMSKHIINKSLEMDLKSVLDYEANAQAMCFISEDCREGIEAFFQKRDPKFK